jgi:hypothetical protein
MPTVVLPNIWNKCANPFPAAKFRDAPSNLYCGVGLEFHDVREESAVLRLRIEYVESKHCVVVVARWREVRGLR